MWKRVNPDGKGEEMLAVDGVITANDRNRITVEVCDKRRPESFNIKTPNVCEIYLYIFIFSRRYCFPGENSGKIFLAL